MKITSNFVLLDVKDGRHELAERLAQAGTKIPIVIRGYLDHQVGNDDGISIEFSVEVESVEFGA